MITIDPIRASEVLMAMLYSIVGVSALFVVIMVICHIVFMHIDRQKSEPIIEKDRGKRSLFIYTRPDRKPLKEMEA